MGNKIRKAQEMKVPYMLVIGDREIEGWLACMQRALEDVAPPQPEDFVELLMTRMRQMAEMLKNR